jgi:branched-subunit amino acid ABC-type transport system permease component
MEYFLQQLINGLTLGSIYGLIAIGYTMVYGIIGMINFAHGDIFMVGSFISLMVIFCWADRRCRAGVSCCWPCLSSSSWRWCSPQSGAGRSSGSPTGRCAARSACAR